MTTSLTPYLITLPTGRAVTVESDSEENALAAAAVCLGLDELPEGTLVVHAEAQP